MSVLPSPGGRRTPPAAAAVRSGRRAPEHLTPDRRPAGRRRAGPLAGAAVVLALAAGCGGTSGASPAPAARPAPPTVVTTKPAPSGGWGPVANQSPVAPPTERARGSIRPVSLSIPAIGVAASSLVPLAILPDTGELAAPADFGQVGWYAKGPVPGEPGPAVIAAHVDSRSGPAPFFRLRELAAGDKVRVGRSDGSTVVFSVTGVERYPKAQFPTQRVHGPTPDRALRLITCGGAFDYAKRSYRDNIVVYAVRDQA